MNNIVFLVIVLYKCRIQDSSTLDSLSKIINFESWGNYLIFDNSPSDFVQDDVSKYNYFRDPNNAGLAKAYNTSLNLAKIKGCKWLLLLDQDSSLNQSLFNYYDKMDLFHLKDIAMIVPNIKDRSGQHISPIKIKAVECDDSQGIKCCNKLFCINSFSLINVDFALDVMKGFDERFPLDMLDYSTCYFINNSNYNYFVLECSVEHSLSVFSKDYVPLNRYGSIVRSELRFYRRNLISLLKYIVRLIGRSGKFLISGRFKHFSLNIKILMYAISGKKI